MLEYSKTMWLWGGHEANLYEAEAWAMHWMLKPCAAVIKLRVIQPSINNVILIIVCVTSNKTYKLIH